MSARHLLVTVLVACALAGCASKRHADPTPEPASPAAAPPESSRVVATYDQIMREVDDTEDAYLKMSLAAAGWLRLLAPGKSIGFYQPDLATPAFKEMVEEVTRAYAFRPVRAEDFRVVCKQSAPGCSMAMADVIAEFTVARMSRDSGYVGGLLTQIPRGASNPEQKPFCITIARHGQDWAAVRSMWVSQPRACPR